MIRTNTISYENLRKKITAVMLSVVLIGGMMSFPATTRAQSSMTTAELQSLLNQLLAQLSAVQNNQSVNGACPYVWTRSLGQGSTGTDVMRLQKFLNMSADTRLAISGAGSPGLETQYYGPITAAAVAKFQTKYRAEILAPLGLSNATGYFGPSSRAKANQLCTGSTTPPPANDDGALRGGAGWISEVSLMGGIANEDVGEGQSDVEVLGLEIEPEGSDIELSAISLDLDQIGHSNNFNRYADEVKIWLDGEEFATIDASDFTRSNEYRRTITLDRGAIIREGEIGELVVSVSAQDSIDSSRLDDQWSATIDNVRFRDAQNAHITDTQMNDLSRTMTFREFASSVGLDVVLRAGDSDINQSRTIKVSSSDRTRDVALLSFKVEVKGDSDVLLDELSVNATTTGAVLSRVASSAYLYLDGDRVGSESISGSGSTITFDDLDLNLEGGETYDFEVRFDLNAANGTNYSNGATIDVDITADNRDAWYIEDENGDEVSSGNRRGTITTDARTLRTTGGSLSLVSTTNREVQDANDTSKNYGEFRMVIEVQALGGAVYIPESTVRSTTATTSAGVAYRFESSDATTYTGGTTSASLSRISGGTVQNGYVRIEEGEVARFELVAVLDPAQADQYRLQLVSFGWNDTSDSPDETIAATPALDYRTGFVFIKN